MNGVCELVGLARRDEGHFDYRRLATPSETRYVADPDRMSVAAYARHLRQTDSTQLSPPISPLMDREPRPQAQSECESAPLRTRADTYAMRAAAFRETGRAALGQVYQTVADIFFEAHANGLGTDAERVGLDENVNHLGGIERLRPRYFDDHACAIRSLEHAAYAFIESHGTVGGESVWSRFVNAGGLQHYSREYASSLTHSHFSHWRPEKKRPDFSELTGRSNVARIQQACDEQRVRRTDAATPSATVADPTAIPTQYEVTAEAELARNAKHEKYAALNAVARAYHAQAELAMQRGDAVAAETYRIVGLTLSGAARRRALTQLELDGDRHAYSSSLTVRTLEKAIVGTLRHHPGLIDSLRTAPAEQLHEYAWLNFIDMGGANDVKTLQSMVFDQSYRHQQIGATVCAVPGGAASAAVTFALLRLAGFDPCGALICTVVPGFICHTSAATGAGVGGIALGSRIGTSVETTLPNVARAIEVRRRYLARRASDTDAGEQLPGIGT